ncbi:MAG: hypothetical protein IJC78_00100 [Clostridia bacterium]|nr:hypothetical protein [Clostridia bacterium]
MGFLFYFLVVAAREILNTSSNGFIKQYQKSAPTGNVSFLIYTIIMSIFAMCFFYVTGGLRLTVNPGMLTYSVLTGIDTVIVVLIGIVAMQYTDLLTINLSSCCGAMILPVLYGIFFLKEHTSLLYWVSVLFMVAAVLVPILAQKKKATKSTVLGYIFCVVLFFGSGFYSVLNKMYQVSPSFTDASSFCFLINVTMLIVCAGLLPVFMHRSPDEKQTFKKFTPGLVLLCVLAAVTSNAASLLNFTAMEGMNLTLLTVFGTSFNILGTAVLSMAVFRERKLGTVDAISIFCALASVAFGAL